MSHSRAGRALLPLGMRFFRNSTFTSHRYLNSSGRELKIHQHLLEPFVGVHGSKLEQTWKNRPLFPRTEENDRTQRFRNGSEAAEMLFAGAKRLDPHKKMYLETAENVLTTLAPVFDRWPKYAWVAKQLLGPERAFTFRVAWLDDKGTNRVNRGYRYQYSSSLGPYEGPLHFRPDLTHDMVKAQAFDLVMSNALSGLSIGASVGGADFDPKEKSEAEIQRFCQSYMAALARYIGPGIDNPTMGANVGGPEIGYLYGQYKRLTPGASSLGEGFLWGGTPPNAECTGYGVVYFAEKVMKVKGGSLQGKRCIVTGSGKVALYAAEKLLELGGIPVVMSDSSGHIYEPEGINAVGLRSILKIKEERGARIGRYIVASTSAKYNEPGNVFDVPCDVVFLCADTGELDAKGATALAALGVKMVVDGAYRPVTREGLKVLQKHGIVHVPYRGSMLATTLGSGRALQKDPLQPGETMDDRVEAKMDQVYEEATAISREFSSRGDLERGCTIAGFLRVARAMVTHGAV